MYRFQNIFKQIDFALLLPVIFLIITGLFTVYSATHITQASSQNYFSRQLFYAVIGVVLIFAVTFVPYKVIFDLSYLLYGISLLLLILVLFIGIRGYGAERWLSLGTVKIQPSEFAKITTVLAVARYLSRNRRNINHISHLTVVFLMILIPFILIAKQPDLGTSLVFLALIIPMLYFAGISWFVLFVLVPPVITMVVSFNLYAYMGWILIITIILIFARQKLYLKILVFLQHILVGSLMPVLWNSLRDYQKQRILTFLQPEKDPRGAGYQIIQSKVAIGSGGVWGKGYLQGSQSQLNFLPAHHTDFIFSVLGEERGFIGIFIVLTAFLFLFLYMLYLSNQVKSSFSRLALIGFTTILFFHTLVNISMTIGLAPVTGLPLPFLSYGGSFLLTSCLLIGISMNFSRNRFQP
ncbi:MAG: rod shape-determining protein RodA [Calditrichaeota bacterium]|nr:rod shape-determining protein RodA [Calditrichota bacterium]